jgi:hypothetical protein
MNQKTVVLNNLYNSLLLPKAMYLPFRIEDEQTEKSIDVETINFLISTNYNTLSKQEEKKIINIFLAADKSKIKSRNLIRSFDEVLYEKSSFLCWIHARAFLREDKYVEAKKLLDISINKNKSVYQYYDEMSNLLFLMQKYKHSAFYRRYSSILNHIYDFSLWDKNVISLKLLFQFDSNYKLYSYSNHFYLVDNSYTLKVFNDEVYEFKNNKINYFYYQRIKNINQISNYIIPIFFLAKSKVFNFFSATIKFLREISFINSKFHNFLFIKLKNIKMFLRNFLAKFKKNQARYKYKENSYLNYILLNLNKIKLSNNHFTKFHNFLFIKLKNIKMFLRNFLAKFKKNQARYKYKENSYLNCILLNLNKIKLSNNHITKFYNFLFIKLKNIKMFLRNFLAKFKKNQARYKYKENSYLNYILLNLNKIKLSKKYTINEVIEFNFKLDKD